MDGWMDFRWNVFSIKMEHTSKHTGYFQNVCICIMANIQTIFRMKLIRQYEEGNKQHDKAKSLHCHYYLFSTVLMPFILKLVSAVIFTKYRLLWITSVVKRLVAHIWAGVTFLWYCRTLKIWTFFNLQVMTLLAGKFTVAAANWGKWQCLLKGYYSFVFLWLLPASLWFIDMIKPDSFYVVSWVFYSKINYYFSCVTVIWHKLREVSRFSLLVSYMDKRFVCFRACGANISAHNYVNFSTTTACV